MVVMRAKGTLPLTVQKDDSVRKLIQKKVLLGFIQKNTIYKNE